MKEVLMSSSDCMPTPCQLEMRWIGQGMPKPVQQKVILEGSKGHKWLSIEYPPPPPESEKDISVT